MDQSMETWLPHFHNRPKLLIVDDQPINIRVLPELFRKDCDVFMATRGEQAITICQTRLPDLILLDVVMEGMDGHEVCRRLKADPATQDIPIIFITAQQQESDEVLGLELGAVDFISKPINPIIVRARVNIEHSASDVDRVVTISLGVATVTPVGDLKFQALIEAADKQLYKAKRTGRGRVCSER